MNIKAEGRTIIIEAKESIAEKYYGSFKVEKWLTIFMDMRMRKAGDNALLPRCQCFRVLAR